jgi:DNA-binding transcriptional regulator YdaS (Cro superfamily)
METSIDRAVKASGGQRALARALGIYPQAVNKWVKAQRVPAERVLQLESLTGVSRHDLRPDLYPTEPHKPSLVKSRKVG